MLGTRVHLEPQLYRFAIFIENMLGERRRGKPNCQEAASRVHVRGAGADTGMSTNGWPENTLPCLEMAPLPGNDSTSLPGGDWGVTLAFPLALPPHPPISTLDMWERDPLPSGPAPAGEGTGRGQPGFLRTEVLLSLGQTGVSTGSKKLGNN